MGPKPSTILAVLFAWVLALGVAPLSHAATDYDNKANRVVGLGTNTETLAAAKTLVSTDYKFQRLNPDSSNRNVDLPALANSMGLWFVITNTGSAGNLVVRDPAASTIVTVTPGNWAMVTCNATTWTLVAAGPASGTSDFGAAGIRADTITESTSGSNVTIGATGIHADLPAGRSSCTTALTATTNVTLANITGMSTTVDAGDRYAFRIRLYTTSTANGGLKLGFGGTATATSIIANIKTYNAATLNTPAQVTSLGALYGATVVTDFVEIDGTIVVNGAGTITLQAAQNASHADTTTVKVGSSMHFELMP